MEKFLERSGIRLLNDEYVVDYGHYQKDAESPHVIVSSGVGTWGKETVQEYQEKLQLDKERYREVSLQFLTERTAECKI